MKNSARGECRPRLPECPALGVCDNPLKRYYLHVLQLDKLQSLQYVAARLVTGARKFDYITPVMRELHWLPVRSGLKVPPWTGCRIFVWVLQDDDRPFTSSISQCVYAVCSAHTDNLLWQKFCCQWTSRVKQFTCGTAFKWHHGGDFQKTSEDISV